MIGISVVPSPGLLRKKKVMPFQIDKYNRDILTAFEHRLLTDENYSNFTVIRKSVYAHLQFALQEAMHIDEMRQKNEGEKK